MSLTYIMMVAGIILAKGLGFFRDIIFARTFGATELTDIYFNIFTVVNLIFTGIGTAMQTLVIKHMNRGDNPLRKKEFALGFIRRTTLILAAATALLYVLAKPLTAFLVPEVSPENFGLALNITYVMLPSLIFVVVAYIISGILQNNRVYFITSIMSLPFNVILIAALFFPNIDIFTLSVVTTIGWFLHIVVQLPSFYRLGFRLYIGKANAGGNYGGNTEVLWVFISNMMFQFCFLLDKIAVSGEEGAATTVNYASNLFVTIASVFVVAMSSVVFPSISQNFEEGKVDYVRRLVQYIITTMLAIFVPFVLTVTCYGENIIGLLYERGEFTHPLTVQTAMLFAVYTLGVLGYMAQELFNKVLYLDSKYNYTVAGTVAVVVLKYAVNRVVVPIWGVKAAAISTTVLFTLYAVNVAVGMSRVIGHFLDRKELLRIGRILLSGGLALAAFFVMKFAAPGLSAGKITFVIPLAVCGAVYIGAIFITGMARELAAKPETTENGGKTQ